MRRGPFRGWSVADRRCRHRHARARQQARRRGAGPARSLSRAALARALGPHPGSAVLLARVRSGHPDLGLRAAHRGRRAQPGDRRHHARGVLSAAARLGAGELRFSPGRARRRVHARGVHDLADRAQPSVRVGRLSHRWRRRVVGVCLGHRAVRSSAPQAALPGRARAPQRGRQALADRDARGARRAVARVRHGRLRHALPPRGVREVPTLRSLDTGSSPRHLRRGERAPARALSPRAITHRRSDGFDRGALPRQGCVARCRGADLVRGMSIPVGAAPSFDEPTRPGTGVHDVPQVPK